MQIRRARIDDAAAIAAVHVRTWQAAYEHVFGAERLAGLEPAARASLAQRAVTNEDNDVFVAEGDGRIVGFATSGSPEDDLEHRELSAIYVLPDAWGTAAARGLMASTLEAMRGRGVPDAILWVLQDNPRARRFYEREGWREDGAAESDYLGVTVALTRYRIDL